MRKLALGILFNGAWFAAVLGGAAGLQWPGLAATAALLVVLAWMRGGAPACWLLFLLACGLYGLVVDGALTVGGLLRFPATPDAWPLPLWMAALWVGFAGLLGPVFTFLHGRPLLAAFLGAVAGPVTYAGAGRFGAAEFADGWLGPACVAVEWALFMPFAVARAVRLEPAPNAEPAAPAAADPA